MVAIYGALWSNHRGAAIHNDSGRLTTEADTWARGLAGLTGAELGRGLEACRDSGKPWPPTLPEFRGWCQVEAVRQLPTELQAYRAACEGRWELHTAVYEAAKGVGTWELRREPQDRTWPLWRREWAAVVERARQGETFPDPPPARGVEYQAPRLPKRAAEDVADDHLAQMREIVGAQ